MSEANPERAPGRGSGARAGPAEVPVLAVRAGRASLAKPGLFHKCTAKLRQVVYCLGLSFPSCAMGRKTPTWPASAEVRGHEGHRYR